MTDLEGLVMRRQGRTRRFSSWDRLGGNQDWITIDPGKSASIAQAKGAGVIRHLWLTINHKDPLYLRKMVIKAYWDGETEASILAPIGDFFCLGHGIVRSFENAAFNAVCERSLEGVLGGGVALNCYFPMPFSDGMRIEVSNESEMPCESLYFYVDYDELPNAPDTVRFHAHYRQEYPTVMADGPLAERGLEYWEQSQVANLDGDGNYLILDAKGEGHFVGCNLSVENFDPLLSTGEPTWWGEGDDMFFIDGDETPSLNGTGSEDYFTQAWGMHDKAFLYGGTSIHEHDPNHSGRHTATSYRLHIPDPIIFRKSLRFYIEHGHANLQQNDYSSVAYWYQTEPHLPLAPLPPALERMPKFARSR